MIFNSRICMIFFLFALFFITYISYNMYMAHYSYNMYTMYNDRCKFITEPFEQVIVSSRELMKPFEERIKVHFWTPWNYNYHGVYQRMFNFWH